MLVVVQRTHSGQLGTEPVGDDKRKRQRFKNASRYPPGQGGAVAWSSRQTSWAWVLAHLSLGAMMILVGVSTYMTDPVGAASISGFFGIALVFYGFFWVFL